MSPSVDDIPIYVPPSMAQDSICRTIVSCLPVVGTIVSLVHIRAAFAEQQVVKDELELINFKGNSDAKRLGSMYSKANLATWKEIRHCLRCITVGALIAFIACAIFAGLVAITLTAFGLGAALIIAAAISFKLSHRVNRNVVEADQEARRWDPLPVAMPV